MVSKETGSFIGVEVKTSEIGIFRLDRQQVEFDKAVINSPGGAYVPQSGSKGGYWITGVAYEGVSLGQRNARWQSFRLGGELFSVGVDTRGTK